MIWTNFPSSLLRQQWLWRFRGNHYPGAHLPMYWQNIHCLCTPVLGLVGAAAAHKGKSWGECSLTLQHKALNDASHTYDTVRVWRYDKAEWNSLITPPPFLARLFVLESGTHTYLLPVPRSHIHLPAMLEECRVSAVTQRATNELQWERLGSVVGTLLPSRLSLPGNRCCLREGPPAARCLNEHQTKTLSNRWVTRVNVSFFCSLLFSPPPPHHSWLVHCFTFWQDWKNKGQRRREKQNSQSVGTFPFSFFLLPRAFISLNSAYTGICAPVAVD